MQSLQDKLTRWAIRGIPFPREKLKAKLQELKQLRKTNLEELLDFWSLDSKTKDTLKGWNSSKLKSFYISTYKTEWLRHLKVTKSKKVSFDRKARDNLLELYPEDKVLQPVCKILDMKTATQQIDKLLVYADGDRLYPNYNLLGAATGRFRVAQPELQNLVANENCNVRELLLEDKNVFMIDFSSQEPRMSAWTAKETKSIEAFIAGENHHTTLAESIGVDYKQAKRIGLGMFYGAGAERVADILDIQLSKATKIR